MKSIILTISLCFNLMLGIFFYGISSGNYAITKYVHIAKAETIKATTISAQEDFAELYRP